MPGNHLGIECEGVFINGHGNGINIPADGYPKAVSSVDTD